MPEDRRIKLVLKDHYCNQIGELSSWRSFYATSRVNDVGEAVLEAGYGHSTENDAVLDELDTADVILEVFIQPPDEDGFLDTPAWAGFLRDRRVFQDGPNPVVRAVFRDYNHLLARRRVKPPDEGSHWEAYDTTANVMRRLVREQAGGQAEEDRVTPGLLVEPDDEDDAGLYGDDVSGIVLGTNVPEWVRCNVLFTWNGWLYAGLETQQAEGSYASIWRTDDGTTWVEVFDGSPGIYAFGVTGVHSFCEFGGQLYAGCSQEWETEGALVMRSPDGVTWTRLYEFPNEAGIWALADFDGFLYAGTTGYTSLGSETYIWRSADGLVWTAQADADVTTANCPSGTGDVELRVCEALYSWGGSIYAGTQYKHMTCEVWGHNTYCTYEFYPEIYQSVDGNVWNMVYRESVRETRAQGIISFIEFDGQLYAGSGESRHTPDLTCYGIGDWVKYGYSNIYRTDDGATWTEVKNFYMQNSGVTSFIETTDHNGDPALWASLGGTAGPRAYIYQSTDGETWNQITYLSTIPYKYCLSLATFLGQRFVSTGCYAKTGQWQADHGDVWYIVPSAIDVSEAGLTGRWESLLDKLRELAKKSGEHDFGVVGLDTLLYCAETQEFEFQVRNPQWGTDNRWDNDAGAGVSFAIAHGNMAVPVYDEIRGTRPTTIYVLGPSSGEERTIEEYQNAAYIEESPWARVEGTVNAQGTDGAQSLQSVGESEIELQGPYKDLQFQVLERDDCHYQPGGYATP